MALDKIEFHGAEAMDTSMPDAKLSDHALIEATRGGDDAAFGEIMGRYRNQITNYLYRFLNDYEEAVDLAQETFVRVYFGLERYHTNFAFSTYIYRIATNLAISEIRRRKRRRLFSLTGLFPAAGDSEGEFPPTQHPLLTAGEPVERSASCLPASIRYAVPLVLLVLVGGYFGFSAFYSAKKIDVPAVAETRTINDTPLSEPASNKDVVVPSNQLVAGSGEVKSS